MKVARVWNNIGVRMWQMERMTENTKGAKGKADEACIPCNPSEANHLFGSTV
jgi:hypothetical protein